MFNPGSAETFQFTFDGDQLKMEIIVPTGPRLGPPGMQQAEQRNIVATGIKMKD
jgi:hypothetical protein